MRKLSRKQLEHLAAMCGTMAVLLVCAAALSGAPLTLGGGASQAAATALGNAQGVPSGFTGQTYPDYTYCQVKLDGKNSSTGPFCRSFAQGTPSQDTFNSAVFSIDLGGSGRTAVQTRTWTQAHNQYTGAASCPVGTSMTQTCSKNGCSYTCMAACGKSGCSSSPAICPSGQSFDSTSGQCYYIVGDTYSNPATSYTGSVPSVSPGQTVTLEWSCLPSRRVDWETCHYNLFDSSCHEDGGIYYSTSLASGVSISGPNGYSYGGGVTGSTQVTVPSNSAGGSYGYAFTCNGGGTGATITVNAVDRCPTAAWQPWGNGIYVIEPGATRKINGAQSFCVTNTSSRYVVVGGGGSSASSQLSSFRSYSSNVGATTY